MSTDDQIAKLKAQNRALADKLRALAEERDIALHAASEATGDALAASTSNARAREALAQYTDANTPAMVRDVLILCDALRTRGWGDSYVIDMARALYARKEATE